MFLESALLNSKKAFRTLEKGSFTLYNSVIGRLTQVFPGTPKLSSLESTRGIFARSLGRASENIMDVLRAFVSVGLKLVIFLHKVFMRERHRVTKTQSGKKLPSSLERARMAARVIVENKGEDVCILDIRAVTQAFDFFVIGSGTSRRQLRAISDEIDDVFEKDLGDTRLSVSGYQESRWVVLDYGDVVVHLFEPEMREYYALEDLWGKGVEIPLEPDAAESGSDKTPVAPVVKDESNN